ncbi:hypothetical protein JY395_02475 [Enterobacter mori]|nr:hypothetical protein JY395_02475 [Enterobacter mori]
MHNQRRAKEGTTAGNAGRLKDEHNLMLLHDKYERLKREHKGKIEVVESYMRWY